MSTIMFYCLLDMLRLYMLSICYPTPGPTIGIKHDYLCLITENNVFPIMNSPICIPPSKPHPCMNMSSCQQRLLLLYMCRETFPSQSTSHNYIRHIFTWFISNLCCHLWCNSQTPFCKQGNTSLPLSLVVRCLGRPLFCLSSSPAISFLSLTTQDWLIPIAFATFCVESPFRSCSSTWSFCDAIERGIQKQLHECSLLHNLQLHSVTMH